MRSATITIFAIAVMGVLLCSMVVKADDTAAINDEGELANPGGLSSWTITADEFKEGEAFTIAGSYQSNVDYTANSFIAIRWPGADGVLETSDPGISWWQPAEDSYAAGAYAFEVEGTATGYGKALIQVSFENSETSEISYLQEYVDFEAGNATAKPKDDVVKQITDFASANLLWIAILVVLFIAIFFSKGAISIVLIVIMFAILAAWFIGWLPTWSELLEWFRGLV